MDFQKSLFFLTITLCVAISAGVPAEHHNLAAEDDEAGLMQDFDGELGVEKRETDLSDGDVEFDPELMDFDAAEREKREIDTGDSNDIDDIDDLFKRAAAARLAVDGPAVLREPTLQILPPPPPSVSAIPARKISFDYSLNVDSDPDLIGFNATDGGLQFTIGSRDDEDSSEWFVVSPSGYEYRGSPTVLRSIFTVANLKAPFGTPSDGIYSSGDPVSDGVTPITSFLNVVSANLSPIARSQRSVFGTDTRVKVNSPHVFPWGAMGRIDTGCTGTFIGPRHILTAGHCVYSRKTKKWLKNLNFRRAKNCNPHQGTLYKWKWAITVKGWKNYGWQSYDYAMIVVDKVSPFRMSYGWRKPIPKFTINIAGYPGDKPGRCMWRTHCKIRNRFSKQLGYRCDTYRGMSGSAVYAYWSKTNKRIIYCIHAYGKTTARNYNKCTRITKSRFNQFKSWINKY